MDTVSRLVKEPSLQLNHNHSHNLDASPNLSHLSAPSSRRLVVVLYRMHLQRTRETSQDLYFV